MILQLFVIDAICVWCMANDVILIPLFTVLALGRLWTATAGEGRPASRLKPRRRAVAPYVIGT